MKMRSFLLIALSWLTFCNQASGTVLNITSVVGVNCSLNTPGSSGCGAGNSFELFAAQPIYDWTSGGRLGSACSYEITDRSTTPPSTQTIRTDCYFNAVTGTVTCELPSLSNADQRDLSYPATFSYNNAVYSFSVMVSNTPPMLTSVSGDCFVDQTIVPNNMNHFFTGSSLRITGQGLFPDTRIIITSTVQPSRTYVLGTQGSGFPGDCYANNSPFVLFICTMPAVDTADEYMPLRIQASSSSQNGKFAPVNMTSLGRILLTGIAGEGCNIGQVGNNLPHCTDNSHIFLTWRSLSLPSMNSNNLPASWVWSSAWGLSSLQVSMVRWMPTSPRFGWQTISVNRSGVLAYYSGVPAYARPAWYDVSIAFLQTIVSSLPTSLYVPLTKMEVREIRGCVNKPLYSTNQAIYAASACHTGDPLTLVPGYLSNNLINYNICLRSNNNSYQLNGCVESTRQEEGSGSTIIDLTCPFPSISQSDIGVGMMIVDCNTGQLARTTTITSTYDVQSYGAIIINSIAGDGCAMGSNSSIGCSLSNYFFITSSNQLFPSDLLNTNFKYLLISTSSSSASSYQTCSPFNTTTARCYMPPITYAEGVEVYPNMDRWMSLNVTIGGLSVVLPSAVYITSLSPLITGVEGCTAMNDTVVNGCYAGSPVSFYGNRLTPGYRLLLVSTVRPGVTYPITMTVSPRRFFIPSLPSLEVNQIMLLQGISASGLIGNVFGKSFVSLGDLRLTSVVGMNCSLSLNPSTTCEGSSITLSGPSIFLGTPGLQYSGVNYNSIAESYVTLTPRGICLTPLIINLSRSPFNPSTIVLPIYVLNSSSLLLPITILNSRSPYRGLALDLSLSIGGVTSNVLSNAFMYPTSNGQTPTPITCSSSSTAMSSSSSSSSSVRMSSVSSRSSSSVVSSSSLSSSAMSLSSLSQHETSSSLTDLSTSNDNHDQHASTGLRDINGSASFHSILVTIIVIVITGVMFV